MRLLSLLDTCRASLCAHSVLLFVMYVGSEQAAVKAGMCFPTPGGDLSNGTFDDRPLRYDLDDLNGEMCLIDFGDDGIPEVSAPNRHLPSYKLMNGRVNIILIQEGKKKTSGMLHHSMTMLDPRDHEFMKVNCKMVLLRSPFPFCSLIN